MEDVRVAGDEKGILRSGFSHLRGGVGRKLHVRIVENDAVVTILTATAVGFTWTIDFTTC